MDGFLLVDKPSGPTSFAVVKKVRRELGTERTGHAGTLDPQATGLLIVALGSATRLLPYLPEEPKRYRFGMVFGTQTDTLDGEGAVIAEGGRVPERQEIEAVLPRFTGTLQQKPPKYSAVKVDGRRAYARARADEEFDIPEKTVTVSLLALEKYDNGIAECELACSRGTYVRALVRDIAAALGTVAYASFIRRLSIGPFSVADAISFDNIGPAAAQRIVPVKGALSSVPSVTVDKAQCARLAQGKDIGIKDVSAATLIAYTETDEVAAVLTRNEKGYYHPEKVFLK